MKRIILSFFVLMMITVGASAQNYTYLLNHVVDAGNPGGLNTDADASTTAWIEAIAPTASANSWSDTIGIPFAFDFYGTPVTHFKVSGNGVVTFDTSATALPSDINTNLPATAGANIPNNSILGFWDSFSGAPNLGTNDRVYTKLFGTAPNRQLWIRYHSYEYGLSATGGAASSFTYWAMAIEEGTNKVYVIDQNYHSGGAALTATVGVQKDATVAVQFADSLMIMAAGGSANPDNDYYEFIPLLLVDDNAGITSIDAPFAPLTAGLQNVDVTLKNHGQNALTAATINWSVNGVVQTPFSWTGNLASQVSTAASVTVGQYTFGAGNFLVEAWTSMPNGVADADPSNDTSSISLCTPLAGTFTVGGAGANYANMSAAFDAIANCGVSGPITFNVAPGTDTVPLVITEVIGMSATNTVTFNGAGATSTTLTHDGSIQNSTILFDGGDYFTFSNMTIDRALGGTYNWGIRLQNTSDHNTFDSCVIQVDRATTSGNYISVLASNSATSSASEGDNCNYLKIQNSEIGGGYYGVRLEGKPGTTAYNVYNQVLNCNFTDLYAYHVYTDEQDSLTIIGNTMNGTRATFGYGIYCFDQMHPNFQSNVILDVESYGIYISDANFDQTPTARGKVINNMIKQIGTSTFNYALYADDWNDMDIYHNTVYTTGLSPAFYCNDLNANTFVKNNIFYSTDGYAVRSLDASSTYSLDYNLYYSGGSNLAQEANTDMADLAAWKLANPASNASSLEGLPNFVDAANGDLHVSVGPALVAGDNSVGVMTDIDGDARPLSPTTVVDMGADEIFAQNLDAGVVSFDAPLPPVTAGLNAIQVSIKNNGVTPLTSVTINWSANGVVQTPFAWTGNTLIGEQANAVTIGNFNIVTGFTQFQVWTSAPNGGVDGDSTNDTLVYDLCTPLTGTINVGGATPDFATIAEAANSMAFCGVSGAVTVAIAPGTYTDAVTFQEAPGASSTNTITFDGGNRDSVLISYVGQSQDQNSAILFDGGDFYTLKNLTIENTGTANYRWVIRLANAADNNTIESNKIIADTVSTSSIAGLPILSSASATSTGSYANNANGLTIKDNDIYGGYYGIRLNGGTGSEAALNAGNTIEGNTLTRQRFYGVYSIYQADLEVVGNHVSNLNNTTGYGIYMTQIMLPKIEENTIINVGTYGIGVLTTNYTYTANKPGTIINNMVKTSGTGDGLYMSNVEDINIYHNTFYAENDQALYVTGANANGLNIKNNIFVSESQSAVDFTTGVQTTVSFDNNIYYRVDGGNLMEDGTTNHANLLAWQTASPLLNVNSLVGDPLFIDAVNGDLHLIGATANDVGDNTVGVTVDIDGDTRPDAPSITVDIGADEYTPLVNDLELVEVYVKPNSCNLPADSVWAVIRSLGLAPATTLNVTTVVSGAVSTTLNIPASTNLTLGLSDTVYVGSFNSSNGGIFNIMSSLTYANDQNTSNDTSAMIMVQRMSAPNATVIDVACLGDSTGEIALNFIGTGTVATVNEVQTIIAPPSTVSTFTFGAPSIDNVQLILDANGDLDLASEKFDIFDENGVNIGFIGSTGNFADQCADIQNTISISQADYTAYAADGVITFTALPDATVNTGTLCPNAFLSLTLTGNGEPTIIWNTGDTTANITGLAPGSYSVTVTDLFGCIQSTSATVGSAINPTPTLTIDNVTDVSCNGANDGAIDVTGTGGTGSLTYTWSNNATTQNLSNLSVGMYNVVVSDANGCTDSSSAPIMITEPDTLSGTATYTVVGCDQVNIVASLTGGTMPYSYSWNNGSIDTTIQVVSGTYDLTTTDANGCVTTQTITTTLPTELSITATATASDTAGAGVGVATVTPADGTAPYTYLWSNGDTTATASALTGGNYTVTVTDANGCSKTETVTVPFPTSANNWSVVSSIEMFPNPTNGLVTFNIEMKSTADLTITIFSVTGQEMTSFQNSNTNQVMRRYDTSLLADGVYMVRFVAGDDVVTKRLVVRK
jgi:hypothetical protein